MRSAFGERFEKIVIAVSTGRTGSQALARHFDACYEQIRGLHEPPPSRALRFASNRYLCGRVSRETMARRLTKARASLLGTIDQPIYLESNPFLHGFLDVFDEVFDEPYVLHVVRHPFTYIRSHINFGVFRGLKGLASNRLPYWMLKPDQYERPPARRWQHMEPAERLAWRWKVVNRELDRGESLFGRRYARFRYEGLFGPDAKEVDDLLRWLELWVSQSLTERLRHRVLNASVDRGFPPAEQWEASLREKVLAQCGELMARYGYALRAPC